MRNRKLPEVGQYIRKRILKQRWYRLMLILSSIVVFCTTYALILPAITLEKQCELPEHIHNESCYAQPEVSDNHVHTEECYTKEQESFICTEHEHTAVCMGNVTSVICGMEEGQEIYNSLSEEEPSEQSQPEIHHHTEACYQTNSEFVCGIESDHQHDDNCYSWKEILSCGKEENAKNTEQAAPVLVCGMEEHLHTEACNLKEEAPLQEESVTAVSTETETAAAIKVDPYITDASLFYKKTEENADWIKITGAETEIPGNASFKLEVNFEKLKIKDLQNAGYQMEYKLPDLFINAAVSASITSGNENVGTMSVENGVVTLSFFESWIQNLLKDNDNNTETELDGSFYVEAEADLSKIPENGTTSIVIGDTTININFGQDIIAQYATVELAKTLVELKEEDDGDYLYYTLSVTAGKDGCKEVVVKDSFSSGKEYVAQYMLPEGENVTTNGDTMVWTVGDMSPNEVKTLTYKVRLKDTYLGVQPKGEITNQAEVYSKEYQRDTDSATFTPKGKATMSKAVADYIPDEENGGGTIRYTIWVQANPENNYTLDNVTIWDALDGSIDSWVTTEKKFRDCLKYEDFHLYEGGNNEQNGAVNLTEIPLLDGTPVIAADGASFRCNVGDFAPGESKTLVYTLKVTEEIFAKSNVDFEISNRATILSDPKRTDGGGQRYEQYYRRKTMTSKKWARKLIGKEVAESKTIDMSGTVYGDDTSFVVPKGSYQYQVVANEAGDWDVSSAVMKDTLHDGRMRYVGYLQVNAYDIQETKNYGTDQAAAADLLNKTPVKTVWIKIDNDNAFEFIPKNFGLGQGTYAYLLSYYAEPFGIGAESTVLVTNEFALTGTVIGKGGTAYTLEGIDVSVSVTLQGTNYFKAVKKFWRYEADSAGTNNGMMYWVIQVDGNRIPSGTEFKDVPLKNDNKVLHECRNVEKAFITDSIEDFSVYENFSELQNKHSVAEFTGYEVTNHNSNEFVWKLNSDVVLNNGQNLYFIVGTEPTELPVSKGWYLTYTNELDTKDPVENASWIFQSKDQHSIMSGDNLYKSMAATFQIKPEKQIVFLSDKDNTSLQEASLQKECLWESGNGIYVAWRISVNHGSTLNGTYRIKEKIPEGMEVVYVQRESTGGAYGSKPPAFSEITGLSNWKEKKQTFSNGQSSIYYVKGQEVIWDVSGLKADPYRPNEYSVNFLIVCKLTDSDVLLGGETKAFNNEVSLLNQSGKEIGSDTDGVELSAPKLSKVGTYDPLLNGGRYPFKIVLNELGTDLVPGDQNHTIRLIDEMNEMLILDTNSIKVCNSVTEEPVAFTSAIENNTLTLVIPDDQPLTITYEASINAAPGDKIVIENNAHWEGYETVPGGSVKKENFSYAAGATVGTATHPIINITKTDQYNNQLHLSDAQFELTEMELNSEGNLVKNDDGLFLTGTTDSNGKLSFGQEAKKRLEWNTVYALKETKAPEGYVTDSTPHYFLIAQKVTVDGKTDYPDYSAYKAQGVQIHYSSATYDYNAYNHKGEVTVTKKFADANGTLLAENLNGTYRFGLFDSNMSETPIQTQTLTYKNGTATPKNGTVKFTNVEFNQEYWIYELNDEGKPIKDQENNYVSGIPFVVSYEDNQIHLSSGIVHQDVVVTNRINYAELPNSGGIGKTIYTISGSILIFAAVTLLVQRKKRNGGA